MEYKPKKYKKNMQLIKSVFIKTKEKIPKLSIPNVLPLFIL